MVEVVIQFFDGDNVAKVSFVELKNMWKPVERNTLQEEIFLEIFEAVSVGTLHGTLRVCDKDHSVGAT